MPNWNESMTQTFEYYEVDPISWMDKRPLMNIIDSRINIDSGTETRGSASFTSSEMIGECYIRVYLITIQNGVREKFPLGTHMVQTPSYSYNGKVLNVSMDAYTPLIELKEKMPPLGYFTPKNKNILDEVCNIMTENMRAPIISTTSDESIHFDFTSNVNDTWITYVHDLVANAKYSIDLDELGKVMFKPIQATDTLQPIWTYTDDNSSILYPAVSMDNDMYGIPNVVEVVYSTNEYHFYVRVENVEESSPTSLVNRGREIMHRDDNPNITGTPTYDKVKIYAENLLRELSSMEYTITYTHGYCPTRVGDCVLLNYKRANIHNVKAKIISQSISCVPGTPVEEKAVFTNNLWRGSNAK